MMADILSNDAQTLRQESFYRKHSCKHFLDSVALGYNTILVLSVLGVRSRIRSWMDCPETIS